VPDSPTGGSPGERYGLLTRVRRAGSLFLLLASCAFLFVYRIAPVQGASMEPTLFTGQTVFYQALPAGILPLHRGDVVVFDSPMDPGRRYVKRLVGLPGDELRFEDGRLRVNGQPVALPGDLEPGLFLSTRVPEGCFYALGDHASVSYDSRRFGAVSFDHLVGRLVYVLP
jgi:signal peptidase I